MRLLCVCHGNICRSPMAEAILDRELTLRGLSNWVVDSAGTSREEVGNPTDPRTLEVLRQHNILFDHVARQVTLNDFDDFDHILVMDRMNKFNLETLDLTPAQRAKVRFVTAANPEGAAEVPDPYYGDLELFRRTYAVLEYSLKNFLDDVSE